jgi:hypothetical protein
MWSWAFSTMCCDVFPYFPELADNHNDKNYFPKNQLLDKSTLYVYQKDATAFLTFFFEKIPRDIKITVATGNSDGHAPWEMTRRFGDGV